MIIITIIILIITVLVYLYFGLVKPVKIENLVPTVIFFDNEQKSIAIPLEIHAPQPIQSNRYFDPSIRIPFPINCRVRFDAYKATLSKDDVNDFEDISVLSTILTELIQEILLSQYARSHFVAWCPFENYVTGPFEAGFGGDDLPTTKVEINATSNGTNNRFISNSKIILNLPERTNVKLLPRNLITLEGPLFKLKFRVYCSSVQTLETVQLAYSVSSSWYRELSSDFKTTTAFLFFINTEFEIKMNIWRFFAEDWLHSRIRPKIKIDDISNWVNDWLETVALFFDWVDEDITILPQIEKARLIDEKSLTYRTETGYITFS